MIKSDKRGVTFTAFSAHEKKTFKTMVMPPDESGAEGARALTALDDFIQCMDYAKALLKARPDVLMTMLIIEQFGVWNTLQHYILSLAHEGCNNFL